MDVTLTQLRYFTEAAAQLSMTAASARLNVAQSAVSAAIAQLERTIGARFFIRQRSKGLVLTSAGELFLRDAQSILAHVEESLDNARGEQKRISGRVRMACFSTLAPFLLPGLLTRLSEEHPALELEVIEADTAGCAHALLTGQVELALCYDMGLPAGIATTVVDRSRPYLALPPDHPLSSKGTVALAELRDEAFVLLDLPYTRDLMLSLVRKGGHEPNVKFRSASYETVRTFVAHGHGYSILHQRPHHRLTYDGGEIAMVEIKDDVPQLLTVLAHLESQRPTARQRAVGQTIRQQIVAADATRT